GPVVSKDAKERIEGYIAAGVEAGAELVEDGRGVVVATAPQRVCRVEATRITRRRIQ
ncbi:hypothetical protein GUG60_02220, partial [Xanthomonas citri pv. citri]|nr:hypothetical protein [Xanthomonas citri pv. citri]